MSIKKKKSTNNNSLFYIILFFVIMSIVKNTRGYEMVSFIRYCITYIIFFVISFVGYKKLIELYNNNNFRKNSYDLTVALILLGILNRGLKYKLVYAIRYLLLIFSILAIIMIIYDKVIRFIERKNEEEFELAMTGLLGNFILFVSGVVVLNPYTAYKYVLLLILFALIIFILFKLSDMNNKKKKKKQRKEKNKLKK